VLNMRCEHCRRTLQIPEQFLGQTGTCKYCGGRITVQVEPLRSSSEAEAEQEEKAVNALVDVSPGNKPSASGPVTQSANKSLFRKLIVSFLQGPIFGFLWIILCFAGGIFAIAFLHELYSEFTGVLGWFIKMGITFLVLIGVGIFKILVDKLWDWISWL